MRSTARSSGAARIGTAGRACVLLAVGGLLAGCGGGVGAPASSQPSSSPPTSAHPTPATGGPAASRRDEQACVDIVNTATTVRGLAASLEQTPVLLAGLALFLGEPRRLAGTPGIADPQLAAAQAELVAALDELPVQAEALLPPGADVSQTPLQFDLSRATAAVGEIERLCAARG